ncbi:PHO85 cyclin-1 [Coemansia sp. RSA 988]|nr:PHO85 cyclin-1 [Coemansia sp. RSA 988]
MSAQVDTSIATQAARPLHLNMAAPLTSQTLDAIQCEITKDMISVIATHARNVIPCSPAPALSANERSYSSESRNPRIGYSERLPSPPTTPSSALSTVPPLDVFITNLVLRSRVQAGTLICTLVYLQRLRNRLPKEARGMECTCHRIFLATLIVAGKYLNDASPKNKYWARYSTVFTVAEVNLMEKQLLFLLDFDLRIDNGNLNEAAAVFTGRAAEQDDPLTPTTPPVSVGLHSTHALEAASVLPAMSQIVSDNMSKVSVSQKSSVDMCTHHNHHSITKAAHAVEGARIYPPNLGLNGRGTIPDSEAEVQSTDITRTVSKPAIPSIASTTPVHDLQVPDISKRQLSYTQQCRVPSDIGSTIGQKTPASLLRQMPVDEKMDLHPSPKKRAVSRGYHGNVPHPSPVYPHHTSGVQSAATTVGMSSSVTAGSDRFLNPLEQASIKYASSRYQQQRYDPLASQGQQPARAMPRMSASIPSLREVSASALTQANSLASCTSPIREENTSNGRSSRPRKSNYALRHQSTLPSMGKRSGSLPCSEMLRMPQSILPATELGSGESALPAPPPRARLASSSYNPESSPVNTLVYEPSPATAAATIGHAPGHGVRSYYQQTSATRGEFDTLAAPTLPEPFASTRKQQVSKLPGTSGVYEYGGDQTLTHAYEYASRHAHHQLPPINNDSQCTQPLSKEASDNTSSGWHLKTKLLYPLSTWFRSGRHQNSNHRGGLPAAAAAPASSYPLPAAASTSYTCNVQSGST